MAQIRKRQHFLINSKFQLSIVGYVLLLAFIILGCVYYANYQLFQTLHHKGLDLGFPEGHMYFALLDEQSRLMNWIFLILVFVTIIVTLIWGIIISHRIAGPIYRICRHLDDIAEDRTKSEVRLRPKDYFPELAKAVNKVISKF